MTLLWQLLQFIGSVLTTYWAIRWVFRPREAKRPKYVPKPLWTAEDFNQLRDLDGTDRDAYKANMMARLDKELDRD